MNFLKFIFKKNTTNNAIKKDAEIILLNPISTKSIIKNGIEYKVLNYRVVDAINFDSEEALEQMDAMLEESNNTIISLKNLINSLKEQTISYRNYYYNQKLGLDLVIKNIKINYNNKCAHHKEALSNYNNKSKQFNELQIKFNNLKLELAVINKNNKKNNQSNVNGNNELQTNNKNLKKGTNQLITTNKNINGVDATIELLEDEIKFMEKELFIKSKTIAILEKTITGNKNDNGNNSYLDLLNEFQQFKEQQYIVANSIDALNDTIKKRNTTIEILKNSILNKEKTILALNKNTKQNG